jgi:superfamily II DNA helicase RecQ
MVFHGSMSPEEKVEIINTWFRTPGISIMVATSAFGTGIDNPHVDLVFCLGTSYNLMDLLQCASRGGRSAQKRSVFLFISCEYFLHAFRRCMDGDNRITGEQKRIAFADLDEVTRFFHSGFEGCSRNQCSLYLDGVESYCIGTDAAPCMYCLHKFSSYKILAPLYGMKRPV